MVQMKVAFVLQLTDDFSGQCIRDKGFQFFIGNRAVRPIEKKDGIYVFLEPQEPCTKVVIESTVYHSCSIYIEKKLLDVTEPVLEVRLYRRPGKQFSPNIKLLSGKLNVGQRLPAEVYAKKSNSAGVSFKEYKDINGEHWIWFSGFTKENLLGKTWMLCGAEASLFIILQEKRGINEYRADIISGEPEKMKQGTPLYRIYRSVTDCYGNYAIPIENSEDTEKIEVMELQNNK